jgi:hypothetical protein
MWNVNPERDQSRGGFQNSDVGRTMFDGNYGPDYGIDYARFVDSPDFGKDLVLKEKIEQELLVFDKLWDSSVLVRNGFVILKGTVPDQTLRFEIADDLKHISGVIEVINQLTVGPSSH